MCGIAGIFDPSATFGPIEATTVVVRAMMASLAHRGPDGQGLWADHRCVLGHRRLKVIDPSDAGHQPMCSADGRHVLVTNGELYNFQELRPLLERRGTKFRGQSDTEVLVECLAEWGERALDRLDGMFALAVFDSESGELLLARDPFGEKPLYYIELGGGGLAFASELHALALLPRFDDTVSLEAIAELMMFQYICHPRTIYASVRKLPPGHWLRVRQDGQRQIERYFRSEPGAVDFGNRSQTDVAEELEELLVRAIRRRLLADVPVGAFLSGGVDSSTVCALARHRVGRRLKTFSIGFEDSAESEHVAAAAFADHLGLDHYQHVLTADAIDLLGQFGALLDEPNVDWSCLPVYLLSSLAREHVTVALSGDGGDEMFAGYSWYFGPLEHDGSAQGADSWRADEAYSASLLMSDRDVMTRLFGGIPTTVAARIRRLRDDINDQAMPLIFRLRRNEAENYLPGAVLAKVDRMSMRHALEVRTPFLNVEVARFAASLPAAWLYQAGKGKVLLRQVARRYLPAELIDRPKMGFGLPGPDWGSGHIARITRNLLGSEDSRLRACLGAESIDAFLRHNRDAHQQWALAVVESWLRSHASTLPVLDRRGLLAS